MQKRMKLGLIGMLAMLLCGASSAAIAEDAQANRERQKINHLQQILQKSEDEKVALLQEKSALETKLGEMSRKFEELNGAHQKTARNEQSAKQEFSAAQQAVETCHVQSTALQTELDKTRAELSDTTAETKSARQAFLEMGGSHGALSQTLKLKEGEIVKLNLAASEQMKSLQRCTANNTTLYRYSVELLEKYQSKGMLDVLRQHEPLTQLQHVELENMAQEYGANLRNQRVDGNNE